jgi:hypothetical protein
MSKKLAMLASVVVVGVGVSLAQVLGPLQGGIPVLGPSDEAAVRLEVHDVTLQEALATLSSVTGYLILAEPDLRSKKVSLTTEGKPLGVVLSLCRQVSAYPTTVVVFCTAQQKPQKEPKLTIPDSRVTVQIANADTAAALDLASVAAKVRMVATDEVIKAKPQVSLDLDDVPVEQAIASIAQALEAEHVVGLLLSKVDPEAAFEALMSLPVAEQERIMLEATRQMQLSSVPPHEIDRHIDEALQQLWAMPRERRQQVVQRTAERIVRLGSQLQRFSPEAQRELKEAWMPVVQRGVGRFLALPANQQAELAPIVEALQKLPFGP